MFIECGPKGYVVYCMVGGSLCMWLLFLVQSCRGVQFFSCIFPFLISQINSRSPLPYVFPAPADNFHCYLSIIEIHHRYFIHTFQLVFFHAFQCVTQHLIMDMDQPFTEPANGVLVLGGNIQMVISICPALMTFQLEGMTFPPLSSFTTARIYCIQFPSLNI